MKIALFFLSFVAAVFCGTCAIWYMHLGDAAGIGFFANPLAMWAMMGLLGSSLLFLCIQHELKEQEIL